MSLEREARGVLGLTTGRGAQSLWGGAANRGLDETPGRREGRWQRTENQLPPPPPPAKWSIGTLDDMKSWVRDWLEAEDQGPMWLGSGGPLPGARGKSREWDSARAVSFQGSHL